MCDGGIVKKGNQYIDCALFRVELESGVVVRLVIPHVKGGMRVEIRHDGFGNFTFPGCRLERIAVVAELTSLKFLLSISSPKSVVALF